MRALHVCRAVECLRFDRFEEIRCGDDEAIQRAGVGVVCFVHAEAELIQLTQIDEYSVYHRTVALTVLVALQPS